jgi:transcription antitermination factor NusG
MHDPNRQDALWYALQVRPRLERVVAQNLRQRGYEEFLPVFRRRSQWSDRVKNIELPLFPTYVFCKFDVRHRLPILTVPGVYEIVGMSKTPTPIRESEILAIRTIVQSASRCEPYPPVGVGERVRVEFGPLLGTEGVVVKLKDSCRLVVCVEALQRAVAVEIDPDYVKPVQDSESGLLADSLSETFPPRADCAQTKQ